MEIWSYYQSTVQDKRDPRMDGYPLMAGAGLPAILTALYILIVWKGPGWMKNRQAFTLKYPLILYNCVLVLWSIYMFTELISTTIFNPRFSLVCQTVDYSNDPNSLRLASVCWMYFFSKIIEFMDTFFFILRKKNNQITFLHVYHHSTMVLLWWIGARFIPGGESYFSALVNSFIHILMYSYYMFSAFGPRVQKYLWWKRYMTTLQLGQFVLIFFHTSYAIYIDCGYPQAFNYALVIYMLSHIALFSNFYYQTYTKKNLKAKPHTNGLQNGHTTIQNGTLLQNGFHITNGTNGHVTGVESQYIIKQD